MDILSNFMDKFGPPVMESYFFYDRTVEIKFDPVEHIYYLVEELGNLTPLLNVSTVSHIVDRSFALMPWAVKMCIEKLLRTIPVETDELSYVFVPEMSLENFTKIATEAKSAHRDEVEGAGEVGKQAHRWIEQHTKCILNNVINTIAMPEEERAKNCCIAALDWIQKHNVRFLDSERKVYSKTHQCSGTLDGIAWVDSCLDKTCCTSEFKDHLSLIDYKTSNYLYTEYLYQSSAYLAFLLEELRKTEQ